MDVELIKGYPSVAFRYIDEDGRLVIDTFVYASDRVFRVSIYTTANNNDSALRMLTSLLDSMKINTAPPTATTVTPPIRRAEPVRNGDSIGEI
jgi:hypothetical protein